MKHDGSFPYWKKCDGPAPGKLHIFVTGRWGLSLRKLHYGDEQRRHGDSGALVFLAKHLRCDLKGPEVRCEARRRVVCGLEDVHRSSRHSPWFWIW